MTPSTSVVVLLAVRNGELARAFALLLDSAGFTVHMAASPDEARELMTMMQPDVILADIDWGADRVKELADAAHTRSGSPCQLAAIVGWWDLRTAEVLTCADTLIYAPPSERQVFESIEQMLAVAGLRLP